MFLSRIRRVPHTVVHSRPQTQNPNPCAYALFRQVSPKNTSAAASLAPLYFRSLFHLASTKMDRVDTSARLSKLRELMKAHKVDIYGKNRRLNQPAAR